MRSRDVRWALGLTALALALRLAFVLTSGRTVVYDAGSTVFTFNDTFFYSWAAGAISMGDGLSFLGHPTAHWPPGYPFLLAGVFLVFGANVSNALVANAVIGALTVPLLYLVVHRALGRAAAIAAGAALAVFPGQILMGDVVLAETLYTFELVGFVALVAVLGRSRRALVALGIFAGLAALTRGEGLLFPLIVLAFGWAPGARRSALRHAAAVGVVMALTVTPWTIRNIDVAGGFVLVSANSSYTLWAGHNPRADGGAVYQSPPELARLSRMSEADAASKQRADAVEWALRHPLRELELIPLKLRELARGDSKLIEAWINIPGQTPLGPQAAELVGGVASVASYALIAALLVAVAAFGRPLWRIPTTRASLAFLALALPLYGFVYYGNLRYRIPLEPLMLVVVAGAAVRLRSAGAPAGSAPR